MKYKLKDIGTITTGKTPSKKIVGAYGKKINFLTPRDLNGQRYSEYTERRLSLKGIECLKNYEVIPPSISVSCIGSDMGKVVFNKTPIVTNQQLNSISNIRKDIDPLYLYYLLYNKRILLKFMGSDRGSTMPILSKREFGNLEFEFPNLKTQKSISSRLDSLDKKIEVNSRINDNLTNQIKYTSNNYFQFFKNHSCKNWTYVKLEDIAKISSGYSYQGNELLPSNTAMATIKNFNRTGGFNTNGFKEIKPKKNVKLEKYANLFDVLVAHTDITQNGDIIGNAEVVLDTVKYKKIICSMDLVKVTPKNHLISPFLLALLLQGKELKKYCLRYVNGTTVLHLNKKAIKKFEIPIPNNISDINNIEKYARYAYKNMSINLKENRILKSLKTEILNKYF